MFQISLEKMLLLQLKRNRQLVITANRFAIVHGRLPAWRLFQNTYSFLGKFGASLGLFHQFDVADATVYFYHEAHHHVATDPLFHATNRVLKLIAHITVEFVHASWISGLVFDHFVGRRQDRLRFRTIVLFGFILGPQRASQQKAQGQYQVFHG